MSKIETIHYQTVEPRKRSDVGRVVAAILSLLFSAISFLIFAAGAAFIVELLARWHDPRDIVVGTIIAIVLTTLGGAGVAIGVGQVRRAISSVEPASTDDTGPIALTFSGELTAPNRASPPPRRVGM